MGIELAMVRPPACRLVNVTSGESMACLFNPTQISEKVQVRYNRLAVPGLSHQVLQFQGTGNRQLPGVAFYLDKFFAAEQPGDPDILEFRAFLRALTVSPKRTKGVSDTAPPRVLFIWPKVLTIETVVTDLEFQYRQFSTSGAVLVYQATCSFEEILDVRVTSETRRKEV